MNYPSNIIVHHTLVSREKNPNQFDAVKRYHISKGWGDIGYHYLIEPSGLICKGRDEKYAGAHCKESYMNFRSLGICLTGNFDMEEPTEEQCKSLKKLLDEKMKEYDIKEKNVVPHRHYATYKSCWGKLLPDDIFGYLKIRLEKKSFSEWAVKSAEKASQLGFWKDQTNPQEPALTLKGTYYLKNMGILTKIFKDKDGRDLPATMEQLNHAFAKHGLLKKY